MFVIKKQLTNTRPSASRYPELIVTPTEGGLKLTPEACNLLNLKVGDYVGVVVGGDEESEDQQFFIHKGEEKEGGNIGSKCAATNKGGTALGFSSMNAWQQLGGNTSENIHYRIFGLDDDTLAAIVEDDPAIPNNEWESEADMPQESEGVTYFPVQETKREAKIKRGEGEDSEDTQVNSAQEVEEIGEPAEVLE